MTTDLGDNNDGGAGMQDACAAASLVETWQKRADAAVCHIRILAAQVASGAYRNEQHTPSTVIEWNRFVSSMFVEEEDQEDVRPYTKEEDAALVKVRMVYHFQQMRSGDIAAVVKEVADLWIGAGIARRITEEEFDRVVATLESHEASPLHAH